MQKYKDFIIFNAGNGYVALNINKPFKNGHTHTNKHSIAMILCKLASRKQMPKSRNKRFAESLIRISDDMDYINRLKVLI